MAATEALTLTEAREKLARLTTKAKNLAEAAKKPIRQGLMSAATIGGGATAGVVRAIMPNVPGTDLPLDGALGTVISTFALLGAGDDIGDAVAAYGAGMAAPAAARWAEGVTLGVMKQIKEATSSSSSATK